MTLALLTGRPEQEKEKCLLTRGAPGPFLKFQAPLGPSTFSFRKGPEWGGRGTEGGREVPGERGEGTRVAGAPGSAGAPV